LTIKCDDMINVTLLHPSSQFCVNEMIVQEHAGNGIGKKPPLGILYVASYLQKHLGIRPTIIDADAEKLNIEQTVKRVLDLECDVLGISAWSNYWYFCHEVAKLVKAVRQNVHICMGGPHVRVFPAETLNSKYVDSIVVGDGEAPFATLLGSLKGTARQTKGLYVKGDLPVTYVPYKTTDVDALPLPDRSMINAELYSSVVAKHNKVTTMITSRGCPYRCIFCKVEGQPIMSRSASSVVDEIEAICKAGYYEIEIYDDTFTWSKMRVKEICNGIIKRKLKIRWSIRDRVNNADPEMLKLMKEAGCARVHYGVESGVQRVLDRIKKGITIDQINFAVNEAKKTKMEVLCYFMLGLPDESIDDIESTIELATKLNPDYATFCIAIPYPGTEMYGWALKNKIIPYDYWQCFANNPTKDFKIPHYIDNNVSLDTLIHYRNVAFRKFYLRPKYLIRTLSQIRSLGELFRKGKMGLGLVQQTIEPN